MRHLKPSVITNARPKAPAQETWTMYVVVKGDGAERVFYSDPTLCTHAWTPTARLAKIHESLPTATDVARKVLGRTIPVTCSVPK